MKNAVLLTLDTLRRDVIGAYGGTQGLTPFLDSIQSHCIRFDQAYSGGPYTQAAFPGILTSSHYLEYGKTKQLSPRRTLISEVLRQQGLETAAFHSNPYLCAFFGWNRGWDTFYDSMQDEVTDECPYIKANVLNAKVRDWLAKRSDPGKPFFLWVHYMDVHEPYVPAPEYIEKIDPSLRITPAEMMRLFKEVVLKRDASNPETVDLLRKLYFAHVREIDDSARDFFGILEEAGVLTDSTVIVTADHGEEFGEHGGLSHDGKMYDELVHVPLMIYEPSRTQTQEVNKVVSTLDVAPTILDRLGLSPAPGFQGRALLPVESYESGGAFGECFDKHGSTEKGAEKEVHYCRSDRFKIIYQQRTDSWELYDLQEDPQERRNIVDESPVADGMKRKILPRVARYLK